MKDARKVIAVFDFDNTITTKDTLFDFCIFYHGKAQFLIGLLVLSPLLLLFKVGFISNEKAKQKFFSYFFKNEKMDVFIFKCQQYSSRIMGITNPAAIEKIRWHQEQNHQVIIISASISFWIKPWAEKEGIKNVLATEIETRGNVLTGQFVSKNCSGQEKVNRLLSIFPDHETYTLYAYGDSKGDKEILDFSDFPFFRKF